ncbi:MAG: hypothetical protein ABJE66_03360 [Deltaproteobacteria bacterium]
MKSGIFVIVMLAACGPANRDGAGTDASRGSGSGSGSGGGSGSGAVNYNVYAHSDTVLYVVDVNAKTLNTVGPFNAPGNDVITDLAVAPDNTIYVISNTAIYTASATDGHVTKLGSLSACGSKGVALTTTPDGKLWTGDFMGTLCQIDTAQSPPAVLPPISMTSGMALSGDFVAVSNGTVFGTAYKKSDSANMGTQLDNVLVKLDIATGTVTQIGPTGYPKLFGVAFAASQVFGFTHDGTGHVVTIDPSSGTGTLFGTFMDPATNKGISFAGAGVSSLVPIIE